MIAVAVEDRIAGFVLYDLPDRGNNSGVQVDAAPDNPIRVVFIFPWVQVLVDLVDVAIDIDQELAEFPLEYGSDVVEPRLDLCRVILVAILHFLRYTHNEFLQCDVCVRPARPALDFYRFHQFIVPVTFLLVCQSPVGHVVRRPA